MLAAGPASRLLRLKMANLGTCHQQAVLCDSFCRPTQRGNAADRLKRCNASAADTTSVVKELKLVSGALCIPHPEKAETGGEDAHFVLSSEVGAMGVADGVGGWADSGISPAEYSRGFMRVVRDFLDGYTAFDIVTPGGPIALPPIDTSDEDRTDLQAAFVAAHRSLRIPGSCTACAVRLDKHSEEIVGLNLGDSGFVVVRDGRIVLRSEPMQHFFDCPKQFGAFPEFVDATDTPKDAQHYNFKVQAGDVIVMGSDGLWDNCLDEDIISLAPDSPEKVGESVTSLAKSAFDHSVDQNFDSPYCKAARKEGYDLEWYEKLLKMKIVDGRPVLGRLTGGKMDDITVLMGYVASVEVPVKDADS